MDRLPPSLLIRTFIIGAALKFIGGLSALFTSQALIGVLQLDRWWMSLASAAVIILILLPWPWKQLQTAHGANIRLILALAIGLISPYTDMINSLWQPTASLLNNPQFVAMSWTLEQVNSVHALGLIFIMLPIVLASWHFGRNGMLISLAAAGLMYVLAPLFLPSDAFNWLLYSVRGFVILGMSLILATTTYTLADAQRREHDAVVTANKQLAQQAMTMEQLATVRERNRLSRELHDTLAHSLSGTAVQLQAVETLIKHDQAEALVELVEARQQIKQGLVEARRAIAALRATPLEDLGLREAILERAQMISRRSGLAIETELQELPTLPPLTEQALFRITDEALLNAEKHAGAHKVTVTLRWDEGQVSLKVEDNGQGFHQPAVGPPAGHLGLTSMQERAKLIDGQLLIDSRPGQGTTVQLTVPAVIVAPQEEKR